MKWSTTIQAPFCFLLLPPDGAPIRQHLPISSVNFALHPFSVRLSCIGRSFEPARVIALLQSYLGYYGIY